MQLLFPWQSAHLSAWEPRGFPAGVLAGPRPRDDRDRHAAVVATEPAGEPLLEGPYRRVAGAVLAYDVFPPRLAERFVSRAPVRIGDTVGLRYRLLPGLGMFIASRVIDVFDGPTAAGWRSGFTYRTLEGHAELGEETFAVEKDRASGAVTVSLTAWSRPGHWLTRLGYWYARRCQLHSGRAAIGHLQAIAAAASPAGVPR